jgi:RNA polymerase sigma-70 factor (ECF subfamily)
MSSQDKRPSFDEFWRRLKPHVRAAAARHPSRDAALGVDDLVQEVRIRVWKVYRRDRNSRLRASYYYKVVSSAIVDCLRAHRGTLSHATRADEEDPEGVVERIGAPDGGPDAAFAEAERAERLQAAIQRLPESRRQAVRLFLQGFTVDEIAELLGCDRNRAHNLTYRGTRQLKQDLNEES